MLKKIFFTLFIANSFLAISQLDIQNKSITQPQMKLMYSGTLNEISITNPINKVVYELKTTASKVEDKGNASFYVTPAFHTRNDTVRIYADGELVQTETFIVKPMPLPTVYIGPRSAEYTSIIEILEKPVLNMQSNGLYLSQSKIISFQLNLLDVNGAVIMHFDVVESNELSREQKSAIKNLDAGAKLDFQLIKIVGLDGITRQQKMSVEIIGVK